MKKTYYKVTSMEQLQKAYDVIKPDKITMLHRYINKNRMYCEHDGASFKECLRDYGQIYFDTEGFATSEIRCKDLDIIIIDIGTEGRYNL